MRKIEEIRQDLLEIANQDNEQASSMFWWKQKIPLELICEALIVILDEITKLSRGEK